MRLASLLCLAAAVSLGGCAGSAPAPARAPVGPLVVRDGPERAGAAYLGSAACAGCHAAAYARWRTTGHAREYAGLPPADRRVTACLRCHVTGYGDQLGFRGGAPDLANVGCEACHGPGGDHARSAYPRFVPTLTGGECPPCEVNRICRLCHTPERSAGFDLSRDLSRITCK